KLLREKGVVVVMGRDHAKTPQDVINTVQGIYEAGYIAEVTFRIPEPILKEAMSELRKRRLDMQDRRPQEPMLLGVGSVINPRELEAAIEMGFDMIVGPDSGMGGCREPIEFVRMVRAAKCFGVPGTFSPSEFAYFLEREDGLQPDGIKIFNASVYGPSGVGGLLAPYQRDRHNGKMIMPTGGVNVKTGAGFQEQIAKRGFCPVLGMSAPLELVTERKKLGDPATIKESLERFKAEFKPYKPA
ncbi:MAG TPA: bifunctional 4-hydroxy-2-oxoglutarate aldolase/2-dehydro-3-deoxy-phosphogluconate aldolase, partial [Candidatus Sulfotelmatobacter sp.]|nr:bifunctional 4-hydroxy-2-oxoglutarate aldolase/2-dehydro-3-deoxy-phosphogluconate aldolase [Candidatus Sulfotelmatobacter sp.]